VEHYGYIRYNTTNSSYEGFGAGNSWASLGGVINVAQDTKITAASPNPDSSNNQLQFYTSDRIDLINVENMIGKFGSIPEGDGIAQQGDTAVYDNIITQTETGDGEGALLTITVGYHNGSNNKVLAVSVTNPGAGYKVGDKIKVKQFQGNPRKTFSHLTNITLTENDLYRVPIERMIIDSNGNIGIGTGDPSEKLEVNGNIKLTGSLVNNSDVAISSTELGYLDGVTNHIQTQIDSKQDNILGAASTITNSNLLDSRALISSTVGKVEVSSVTKTELGYLDGVTSPIQTQITDLSSSLASGGKWNIGSSNKIYYNSGNVGIGTDTPDCRLQLFSNASSTDIFKITSSNTEGHSGVVLENTATSGGKFFMVTTGTGWNVGPNKLIFGSGAPASSNVKMTMDNTGNVGIGTNAPLANLHVKNASYNTLIQRWESDGGRALDLYTSTDNNNGPFTFNTGNSIEFKLDNNKSALKINTNGTVSIGGANGGGNPALDVSGNLIVLGNIQSTGNVGIGNTDPLFNLHVGPSHNTIVPSDGNGMMIIHPDSTSDISLNDPKDILRLGRLGTWSKSYPAVAAFKMCRYENPGTFHSRARMDIGVTYGIEGASAAPTVMSLRGDGNVGIGTTSPGAKLDVSGNIKLSGSLFAGSTEITTTKLGYLSSISDDIQAQLEALSSDVASGGKWSAGTSSTIYYNSGNVGIGTNAPLANLHVKNDLFNQVIQRWDCNGRVMDLITPNTSNGSTPFIFNTGNAYQFQTDGILALDITATGDVGIGKTGSQSYALDVSGNLNVNGSISSGNSNTVGIGSISSDQGSYIDYDTVNGSGATYFVNNRGDGVGGFYFHNQTNSDTLTNQVMLIDTNGDLYVKRNVIAILIMLLLMFVIKKIFVI
jgi:hypothetical protein